MKRLFILAAAVLLILQVVGVRLWMRSYREPQSFRFFAVPGFHFASEHGMFGVLHLAYPAPGNPPFISGVEHKLIHRNLAFRIESTNVYPDSKTVLRGKTIQVQYWVVLLAIAAAFSLIARRAFVHHRARHRLNHRLCPVCGYDLRASPERCPECGAEAMPEPAEGAAA